MPLRLPRRPHDRPSRRLPPLARTALAAGLASLPVAAVAWPALPAQAGSWRQSEWWLRTLHVTQAWRAGEGAGVTVAVLADGVDAGQPDLSGSVVSGPDFTRSGRLPGHALYGVIGTGIASLIAGHGHGRKSASGERPAGIHGIAGHARILSVRVTLSPGDPLWSSRSVTSRLPGAIAAGIRYAVSHGASVIALPADPGLPGVHGWGGAAAAAGGSAAERAAVAYAAGHDVVLIAPAGDNARAGDAPDYPAAYRGVVAVGAVGRRFIRAPYSSRRGYVALTSPGAGVLAAAPAGYQTMNSTWAASAIVAGVAALVRSQYPNLSAPQVVTAMARGTRFRPRHGAPGGAGHGTLDAQLAVAQAASLSPPHARAASAGALPWRRPPMPPVESEASIIETDLIQDGAIAGGALVLLLTPILWYGSVARRRDEAAIAASAARRPQRAIAAAPSTAADPLLGYFGPQQAPDAGPQAPSQAASPRFQPRPGLTGRSTLSAEFAPRQAPPEPRTDAWAGAAAFQAAPVVSARTVPGLAGAGPAGGRPAGGRPVATGQVADSPAVAPSAGAGPAGTGPAGTGPAGTGPAGPGPGRTGPAGTGPAGNGPAETGAAGTAPAWTGDAWAGSEGAAPAGTAPGRGAPGWGAPEGAAPAGTAPAGTGPAGTRPAGTRPGWAAPAGTAPAGKAPAGTAPAGTAPAGTAPAGTAPGWGAPEGAAPAGTAPAGAAPAGAARDAFGGHGEVASGQAASPWGSASRSPASHRAAPHAGGRPARPGPGEPGFWPAGHPTVRHAPVSGSPPWEPAPRPTSELPWAAVSGPPPGAARPIGRPAGPSVTGRLGPPEPAWPAGQQPASPAPGSMFEPAARPPAAPRRPEHGAQDDRDRLVPGQPSGDQQGWDQNGWELLSRTQPGWDELGGEAQAGAGHRASDTGTHPIYVWHPAEQPGEE